MAGASRAPALFQWPEEPAQLRKIVGFLARHTACDCNRLVRKAWRILVAALSLTWGPGVAVAEAPLPESASRAASVDGPEGFEVSGMTGSIDRQSVDTALLARGHDVARCLDGAVDAGLVRLLVRVRTDGSVAWAYPSESTVANRDVERCLSNVMRTTTFAAPNGGEATFSWSIAVDGPVDTVWDASHVATLVDEHTAEILATCAPPDGARFRITARVTGQGRIATAGVATDRPVSSATLDCVASQVARWRIEEAGPARVSFMILATATQPAS